MKDKVGFECKSVNFLSYTNVSYTDRFPSRAELKSVCGFAQISTAWQEIIKKMFFPKRSVITYIRNSVWSNSDEFDVNRFVLAS